MLELHSETKENLDQLMDELPQGLLLKGQLGVGLLTLAKEIAGKNLRNIVYPTDKEGNFLTDRSGEIRISQIRELILQTRGKSLSRQIIIIDNADKMNRQAQNSFLKLLEEPTINTHFILTAHDTQLLLPTITSRVQSLIVNPISSQQTTKLIFALGETNSQRIKQLLFLAEGRAAEITRLINDPVHFERQVAAVGDARQFLGGSLTERIEIAQKYHSDRPGALLMLELALQILKKTTNARPNKSTIQSADQVATVYERIMLNGNVRLQLLSYVVQ